MSAPNSKKHAGTVINDLQQRLNMPLVNNGKFRTIVKMLPISFFDVSCPIGFEEPWEIYCCIESDNINCGDCKKRV